MDNDEEDFVNYNTTKKKKTKRNQHALKYTKTCAIYGIFDCTCCKKVENNRVHDTVIDETLNQPSTSRRLSNEDDDNNMEQNSNDELLDDIIDVGTDCMPSTSSNRLTAEESENKDEEICDTIGTNESLETNTSQEDVMDYIKSVYEEFSSENNVESMVETSSRSETSLFSHTDDEIEPGQANDLFAETVNPAMDATCATTSESLSTDETMANDSIKSEVLPVTEEEEEIDVVNIPAGDILQNTLIENSSRTETVQQETTLNEIKTECSDDENQIIDILNFDDTNNFENNHPINMESTSNANEDDEIIDVENLNEGSSSPSPDHSDFPALRLRRRSSKRRVRSQITINFHKRPRLLRSVMTIDLINSSRDDSIIEITDSPVAPRKVTEVINVDDDDENEDTELNTTCSPRRLGLGNCPVCLESLAKKEIMSTICGHVYCARCIKNVIKTTKKCPNCRKNLTLKSIHPLFI